MPELEDCISNNKCVDHLPLDIDPSLKLRKDEVFSVAFSIVCTLGSFIQPVPLDLPKQQEILHNLAQNLALHHFYRFIAVAALEEFLALLEGKEMGQIELDRTIQVIHLLIQQVLILSLRAPSLKTPSLSGPSCRSCFQRQRRAPSTLIRCCPR